MKINQLTILAGCAAMLALVSCKEQEPTLDGLKSKYVSFAGWVEDLVKTRASGTQWGIGDAIGVYMKASGGDFAASTASNVKYTTGGDGRFTAATAGVEFPADGSKVEFIAYYPYMATLTGSTYAVDIKDQKTDLLYSDNAKAVDKTNAAVALNFKHKLSKLVLHVEAGSGINGLTGLTVSATHFLSSGTMDLATGQVTPGTTREAITPVLTVESNKAVVSALVMPGDNLGNVTLKFTLGGKVFDVPIGLQVVESGKMYSYTAQLTTNGAVMMSPSATIEDWTEGVNNTTPIVLTPSTEAPAPDPNPQPNPNPNPDPQPSTQQLLFPGADFENWSDFTGCLNTFGLMSYCSQAAGAGRTGAALKINLTTVSTKNDYIFTALAGSGAKASMSKIHLYVKGTSVSQSLSFNLYGADGKYVVFNLGDCTTTAMTLDTSASNSYAGAINTSGNWVKVTLNVPTGMAMPTTAGNNLFAVKFGSKASLCDLLIDDITFE